MGCAEVISLSEVRARKQWDGLRQELHTRFDQWLDDLEARLPEPETTLAAVSDLVWQLRQDLTGGLTETLLTHAYALTITHNFRALREQPKGQVGDNKNGAADNTL